MVASTWSLEVAAYSVALLVVDGGIDAIRGWRYRDGVGARHRVLGRVAEALLGATASITLLVFTTRWRSGVWPNPHHYFEFFNTYEAGLGFVQPDIYSAWSVMLIGCAVAMTITGLQASIGAPRETKVIHNRFIFCVSSYGFVQFTYYVFRPHSNNLLHIMFPSSIIAIWCLSQKTIFYDKNREELWRNFTYQVIRASTVIGIALVGASGITELVPRFPSTFAGHLISNWHQGKLFALPHIESVPSNREINRVEFGNLLIGNYPGISRIPMILDDDLWIFAIIGTKYVNVIPLSYSPQDELIPIGHSMAIEKMYKLRFGEDVIIDDSTHLAELRVELLRILCRRGSLVTLGNIGRASVVRFVGVRRGDDDVCQQRGLVPVP